MAGNFPATGEESSSLDRNVLRLARSLWSSRGKWESGNGGGCILTAAFGEVPGEKAQAQGLASILAWLCSLGPWDTEFPAVATNHSTGHAACGSHLPTSGNSRILWKGQKILGTVVWKRGEG